MKSELLLRNVLIFLLLFLALGAIYGGVMLIIWPDGSVLGLPEHLLEGMFFSSFLVPGFILVVLFGLFPLFVVYGLLKTPKCASCDRLNVLPDFHFAWTFTVYLGFAQIIWIDVQTFLLNEVGIFHMLYSGIGILIVCLALLAPVRKLYGVNNSRIDTH